MSTARIAWHQYRYDRKIFWRNPASVFFTVLLPVIFLVLFAGIFGNDDIEVLGSTIAVSTYYVPGLMTLAIVSATMVSLAIALTEARESGVLKRVRGTPVPAAAVVAGRVGNSVSVSLLMVVVMTVIGALAYDVEIPTSTAPGVLIAVAVGAAAFSCLGFALATVIPSEDAAPPITNFAALPLYFLSGVFIPESEIPATALDIAGVFPIRPLFEALLGAYSPGAEGLGVEAGKLAIVAAWGLAGLAVAVRRFRWEPRGS